LCFQTKREIRQMKIVPGFFALLLLLGCASTQDAVYEEAAANDGEIVPPVLQITPESYPEGEPVPETTPHPHDLPLGIWDVWAPSDWTFAVEQTRTGDLNYLDREFSRLSGLNATFIVNGIANEPLDVEAHRRGLLKPAVTLAFAAEHADSAEAQVTDNRIPGGWPRLKSYNDVISRFAYETDLGDLTVRQTAFDILDEIVESQFNEYGLNTRSTPFYLVLKEGWERGIEMEDVREFSLLFEYTVDKIRERDRERSIIYFGSYSAVANREAFHPELISKPGLVDSVFTGQMMRGWNVFNNEWYPFFSKQGGREWVLRNYSGAYYHRNIYNNYCYWLRELTRDVERYAEAVDPIGPRPEWWHDIQTQREERISADGSYRMIYRRPTRLEYGMHAYLALASGARGISFWTYKGGQMMGEYEDLTGSMTPHERPLKIASRGTYAREIQNFHGVITPRPTSYDDSLSIENFRKPLSETDNNPDAYAMGLDIEPYPGNHYPYDRIADLYANLHTLLPQLRALRWWWALDGVDSSYFDIAGEHKELLFDHRSIDDTMGDDDVIHDRKTLGQRFRLRAIHDEDEGPVDAAGTKISSNIYVGLFDDPEDPNVEFYLLVNTTCNEIDGDIVIDATRETVARLVFDGDTPLDAQLHWHDLNRDQRELPEEMVMAAEGRVLEVPLLPGDTKLIAVRSR